jgi:hypothetical protein
MSWAILIWTGIFILWTIVGVSDRASEDCPPGDQLCIDASDVGTGIGVALIWMLWFIGFLVLSIIWFMTRRKGRVCPACGEDVKKGRTTCKKCGHDFAAAAAAGSGTGATA